MLKVFLFQYVFLLLFLKLRWTIKARVTNKTDIRTWSNARGDGKLFSLDLMDESGEIRATAFNAECDKFYHMIEVSFPTQASIYLLSKNQYLFSFKSKTRFTTFRKLI